MIVLHMWSIFMSYVNWEVLQSARGSSQFQDLSVGGDSLKENGLKRRLLVDKIVSSSALVTVTVHGQLTKTVHATREARSRPGEGWSNAQAFTSGTSDECESVIVRLDQRGKIESFDEVLVLVVPGRGRGSIGDTWIDPLFKLVPSFRLVLFTFFFSSPRSNHHCH